MNKAMNDVNYSRVIAGKYLNKAENAKSRGLKFELSLNNMADLVTAPQCAYLDTKLKPKSVTIERLDPNQGYHTANCVSVSERANKLKNAIFDRPLREEGNNNFQQFLGDSLMILSRLAIHTGYELVLAEDGAVKMRQPKPEEANRIKVGQRVKVATPKSCYHDMEGKIILIEESEEGTVYSVHITNVAPEGSPRKSAVAKVKSVEKVS